MDKVDEFLAPKLPEFGYAVDVGANDGRFYSNSLHFEEKGWLVMCVEPNPLLSANLRSSRKLTRSVACGSHRSKMEFVSIGTPPYPSGSGFHTDRAWQIFNLPKEHCKFQVDVLTLNEILEGSGFPVLDLLMIDVEGHELPVLTGCDFTQWKPRFVVAESWGSEPDFHSHLVTCGYHFAKKLGFDFIYERN